MDPKNPKDSWGGRRRTVIVRSISTEYTLTNSSSIGSSVTALIVGCHNFHALNGYVRFSKRRRIIRLWQTFELSNNFLCTALECTENKHNKIFRVKCIRVCFAFKFGNSSLSSSCEGNFYPDVFL